MTNNVRWGDKITVELTSTRKNSVHMCVNIDLRVQSQSKAIYWCIKAVIPNDNQLLITFKWLTIMISSLSWAKKVDYMTR